MRVLSKLFEISPYPELFARSVYYSFFRKFYDNKYNKLGKKEINKKDMEVASLDPIDFFEYLKKLGICDGDLLIVHSSAAGLKRLNCRENDLLVRLKKIVGEAGTLVLPAFPDETLLKEINGIKIYDPKRSVAWTGMLPNLMLRTKGAVRSSFPYNPLIAFGPLAEDMMRKNLDTNYAHGKNSCWSFCAEHHAKILFLGLPAFHSNTVVHVSEDYMPEFWPGDWYLNRDYYVKLEDGSLKLVSVRVRDIKWAKYLSERYTEHKYIKKGFIKAADYKGISVRYIEDCSVLINALLRDWKANRFYYIPMRRLHPEKVGQNVVI